MQLEDGPSAGYHGYWITDFTQVDPHLGTNQDPTDLVDAAHQRGIKVFFDIITNHTADVIGYTAGDRTAYVSGQQAYRDAGVTRSTTATSPAPPTSLARPGDVVPIHARAAARRGGPQRSRPGSTA